MKKKLFGALNLVLMLVATGCGGIRGSDENEEKVDTSKTQINVFNFDGGIGTDWLYKVKRLFEEKYKDVSFEEGKVGAQIMPYPKKTNGYVVIDTFKGSTYDVMFNEYIRYNDFASQGLLLDISDIVEQKAVESENKTIKDKLRQEEITALTAFDGKYYALPHYEVYQGVIYDIDLFDSKKLYFADEIDNGNDGFIISKNDKKSCGPDGIYNTQDDGLPSSYDEFFALCDYMVLKGVTPFVWTGQYQEYTENLLDVLRNNMAGKETQSLNYTLDSNGQEVEIVSDFDNNNNPIIEKKVITPSNANLLRQQPSKYYPIKFLERILSNSSYYHPFSRNNSTFSHTDAQEKFIFSSLENEPIAMLMEGSWWENEATVSGAVDRSINTYGDRAKNRNFGFMPVPQKVSGRVHEGEGGKMVLEDFIMAYGCIRANIEPSKIKLAKEFLKFCYSDEGLQAFTTTTGISKGVNYDLTDEQLASMTPFARNLFNLRKNADIIYPHSANKLFINNERVLTSNVWETVVDNEPYILSFQALKNGKKAEDVFKGMKISDQTWNTNYSKWFE